MTKKLQSKKNQKQYSNYRKMQKKEAKQIKTTCIRLTRHSSTETKPSSRIGKQKKRKLTQHPLPFGKELRGER